MFLKVRPIRFAGRQMGDFPADGEASLAAPGPVAGSLGGFGGGGHGGRKGSSSAAGGSKNGHSIDGPDAQPAARMEARAGDEPEPRRNPESGQEFGPKTGQESSWGPQHPEENGVPEDMATMVLDNSALGTGSPARSGSMPETASAVRAELDPASDAAIMLRVAEGDDSAFNFLVAKHHRAVIHFLFRMVRNQAVAEELTQEVFLRVYRARSSYRAEARFTTWLYRIATNLAVNHARDTKHERSAQTVYLDAADEETGTTPDVADDEPSAEQRLLTQERLAAIRSHVMALPERQRMAVLMHKYQGMDYRQIGEVLKLSESATKSLLFRAYQTLRDKLKDFV
jgi:RNA polymerase sigma-70 factor (ECF subfamily)